MTLSLLREVLFTHRFYSGIAVLLLSFEFIINYQIIQRVQYTEIDWKAYMQEVDGVINGERNYLNLKGDTGPLVYPAGFVWVYQLLFQITSGGINLRLAQYIFMGVYLATLAVVLVIYKHTRIPPILLPLLVVSKRLHSIFVLRLFNDTIAMLFAYVGIAALTGSRRWMWYSGVFLSLGISVKMNVQLMLPGAAYIWWRRGGVVAVGAQLAVIVAIQAVLAAPFLSVYPKEYMARAFDFGRQFDYTWTVNWRFISKDVFLSTDWSTTLLLAHAVFLAILGLSVWPQMSGSTAYAVIKSGFRRHTGARNDRGSSVSADEVIAVMFTANFVGVVCARSLHYQFYSWYFHMLPYLLHISCLPLVAQFVAWVVVEYAWNVYPSTSISSLVLLATHLVLLIQILRGPSANVKRVKKVQPKEL
ncbi:glycosyltransferase [Kickxella alabastrina]|uniref:glycosyltransferase n=1 Tax=Kickxella alabastrina TaxID=61397 RepID=UPI002221072B|nr:glycosyltransferase [Kickxella alabastrina]KAI7831872.1 glycosyltransferase [Kickxella alabastrina]